MGGRGWGREWNLTASEIRLLKDEIDLHAEPLSMHAMMYLFVHRDSNQDVHSRTAASMHAARRKT